MFVDQQLLLKQHKNIKMSKPRVAICFAGLPSYIDDNKGYWQEVIERYDADVYASLWEDEEQLVKKTDTIRNFIDS